MNDEWRQVFHLPVEVLGKLYVHIGSSVVEAVESFAEVTAYALKVMSVQVEALVRMPIVLNKYHC